MICNAVLIVIITSYPSNRHDKHASFCSVEIDLIFRDQSTFSKKSLKSNRYHFCATGVFMNCYKFSLISSSLSHSILYVSRLEMQMPSAIFGSNLSVGGSGNN